MMSCCQLSNINQLSTLNQSSSHHLSLLRLQRVQNGQVHDTSGTNRGQPPARGLRHRQPAKMPPKVQADLLRTLEGLRGTAGP